MKSTTPKTLSTAVQRGLLRLASMSPPYCPGPDVMPMTEVTWIDALTDAGLTDADVDRIAIAFRALAYTCTTWPLPRQLIDALPPKSRTYYRAMPAPIQSPEQDAIDHSQRVQRLASVREILKPFLDAMRGKGPC